jgi:hypothetical protein
MFLRRDELAQFLDPAELTARLERQLTQVVPAYGLDWGTAERVARLHELLGNHVAAQRYFCQSASLAEGLLHKFKLRDGVVNDIDKCSHVALLYKYAGEEDKASALFDYALSEGADIHWYTQNNYVAYLLSRTMVYSSLATGDLTSARQHLQTVKVLSERYAAEQPEFRFPAACEAIEMMLDAVERFDEEMAERSLAHLSTYIQAEGIQPDTMARISEWDILNMLMAVRQSAELGIGKPERRAETQTTREKAELNERLNDLLAYTLPTSGLDWRTAERLGRLYKAFNQEEVSRRYFGKAAQLKNDAFLNADPKQRKPQNMVAIATSRLHLALLCHRAAQLDKAQEHLQLLIEETADTLDTLAKVGWIYPGALLLRVLIYACLFQGNLTATEEYLQQLKQTLATPEGPGLLSPAVAAIEKLLEAKAAEAPQLANEAVHQLGQTISAQAISIDSFDRVSERDIVEQLQRIALN